MFKKKRNKIFCIGFNKTGTTSLGYFLEQNGFIVENQRAGELLLDDYLENNFSSILKFCRKSNAQCYQDIPFSLPGLYKVLDKEFKNAKFILTVRDDAEEWFNSIHNFHSNFYAKGKTPNKKDLEESRYVYPGYSWNLMTNVFNFSSNDTYNKVEMMRIYNSHILDVKDYFSKRPNKLLVINLKKKEDFKSLCQFLEIKQSNNEFPRISSDDIISGNYNCEFLNVQQRNHNNSIISKIKNKSISLLTSKK